MRSKEVFRTLGGSIVIYFIVAACGGHGTDGYDAGFGDALTDPVSDARADVNQGGSRLKTKRYVGADGSSQFIGLHDSQLNVDCAFNLASDGMARCLPASLSVAAVGTYFADSGCSKPLASAAEGCAAPPYAFVVENGSCAAQPKFDIFSVAGAFNGSTYVGTPGNCTAVTPQVALYSVGAEVPASQFVQGTVQVDP